MNEPLATSFSLLSAELVGLEVPLIEVEVHASCGLPRMEIVGLAETCVRESKQRVQAAIVASGWRFPEDKITVNLAPASLKKIGTGLDLPMAVGILLACKQIEAVHGDFLRDCILAGELSLSGNLRPMPGFFNVALMAKSKGIRRLILPHANLAEAALVSDLMLYPVRNLREVIEHIQGEKLLTGIESGRVTQANPDAMECPVDLAEICGQSLGKQALLTAAAGGHNLLLMGPPGVGKTLLARALPGLLPPLEPAQALETTRIHSVAGLCQQPLKEGGLLRWPPFRAPHHTMTDAGLVGGGRAIAPGEVSLAHNGVLFLDELPEFRRHVLEILREPLESGKVFLARAAGMVAYPARFQLIAAMNPCPCGYSGVRERYCQCSIAMIRNYHKRVSGPLLDRMDLRVQMGVLSEKEVFAAKESRGLSSAQARVLVERAREIQRRRYPHQDFALNAHAPAALLAEVCALDAAGEEILKRGIERSKASMRGTHRILRVARTLADLKGQERVDEQALLEALNLWNCPMLWT